jgi:hypothetical protein
MKKLIFVFIILFVACSNGDKKIKTETITKYNSIEKDGKQIKDTIDSKYKICFYPSGNQSYFIGLIGWGKLDTTFYPEREPNKVKVIENKTFYYGKNDSLVYVTVKKGDTIFNFDPISFDYPVSYSIYHNKKLSSTFDCISDELETYKDIKYDENHNIISALVYVDFIPDVIRKEYTNEIKLAEEKLLKHKAYFFEAEYEYYK